MGMMHKNTVSSGLPNTGNTAETIIYTTPALSVGQGDGAVGISGTLNITPGTSATGVTIRIRQGTLVTGPLVGGSPVHTVAAGAPQSITFGATDLTAFLEQVGGGQYVITAQQTGGAAAGVVNLLDVEVLV